MSSQRSPGCPAKAPGHSASAARHWEGFWRFTPPHGIPVVRAVAAICPAHQYGLADRRGLTWALDTPLQQAVARDDAVARGYWHATGDELVPWQWSQELFGLSPHPRHLRIVMGGHHTSLQHDPRVQADTVTFLRRHLALPDSVGKPT